MKSHFYPIKFQPILKERIWGGTKLKTLLNKKTGHQMLVKVGRLVMSMEILQL